MHTLGKASFVLAPICLFASFFLNFIGKNSMLSSVLIVLATIFLILAVAEKAFQARSKDKEEQE